MKKENQPLGGATTKTMTTERYTIKNIGNGGRTEDPYGIKIFTEAEARDYVNALKKHNPDAEFCGYNPVFKTWVCHYTPSV